jgi:hypothetical protein
MTAHITWIVEDVAELGARRRKAAAYLLGVGAQRQGAWGYNDLVGADCDSTAQALIVLQRAGVPIEDAWGAALIKYQDGGGGFATFDPSDGRRDGWRRPHPDTTAAAIEALGRLGIEPQRRARAVDWLDSLRSSGGLVAYWWATPAYLCWCLSKTGLATEREAAIARDGLAASRSAPELPMLLQALGDRRDDAATLRAAVSILVEQQLADGSWRCAPCLRLTDPRGSSPSSRLSGRVYPANRRLLVTAHCVAALSRLRDLDGYASC